MAVCTYNELHLQRIIMSLNDDNYHACLCIEKSEISEVQLSRYRLLSLLVLLRVHVRCPFLSRWLLIVFSSFYNCVERCINFEFCLLSASWIAHRTLTLYAFCCYFFILFHSATVFFSIHLEYFCSFLILRVNWLEMKCHTVRWGNEEKKKKHPNAVDSEPIRRRGARLALWPLRFRILSELWTHKTYIWLVMWCVMLMLLNDVQSVYTVSVSNGQYRLVWRICCKTTEWCGSRVRGRGARRKKTHIKFTTRKRRQRRCWEICAVGVDQKIA